MPLFLCPVASYGITRIACLSERGFMSAVNRVGGAIKSDSRCDCLCQMGLEPIARPVEVALKTTERVRNIRASIVIRLK